MVILAVIFQFGRSSLSNKPVQHEERTDLYEPANTKKQAAPNNPAQSEVPSSSPSEQKIPPRLQIQGKKASVRLELGTSDSTPAYDQDRFEVNRNEIIQLHFTNHSAQKLNYLHNFVLTEPEMEGKVAMEATRGWTFGGFYAEYVRCFSKGLLC